MSDESKGNHSRDINAALRVEMALNLRAQRLTYDAIAQRCGYSSARVAHQAIQREMQRRITPRVDELRAEEVAMLDTLHAEVWELAMDKANRSRLFAVDRILTISEARRKLLGLDIGRDGALAQTVIREVPAAVRDV